jgi:hypothetical protein
LAPHFSFGQTILPDTSPFFKNGSIHVSWHQPSSHLVNPSHQLTGSTKYPEHFGLTRIGGPLVAMLPSPLAPPALGVIANRLIRLPMVPEFEPELSLRFLD